MSDDLRKAVKAQEALVRADMDALDSALERYRVAFLQRHPVKNGTLVPVLPPPMPRTHTAACVSFRRVHPALPCFCLRTTP